MVCKQTFTIAQARGNPPKALNDHCDTKHSGTKKSDCFTALNDDGTKKVDDSAAGAKKKEKSGKTNVKTSNKTAFSGDLPPELLAAMAKTKVTKKKKK